MTYDTVVAALAAEGYSRDRIRTVMDSLAEADWREEDDDWSEKDLAVLRTQLGSPAAALPNEPSVDEPDKDTAAGPDLQREADVWAADLARVLDRTTGGKSPLTPDQIRPAADHLLRWTTDADSYIPDFSVEHWADGIEEAIRVATNGDVELPRVELQVAANLLLHAQEDDWVSQAAMLRAAQEPEPEALPDRDE